MSLPPLVTPQRGETVYVAMNDEHLMNYQRWLRSHDLWLERAPNERVRLFVIRSGGGHD